MMNSKKLLLTCIFAIISLVSYGQSSRNSLEEEKKKNLEKIKTTQLILDQTRKKKTYSVGELQALNKQIATQEQQLVLMEQDLGLIEKELSQLNAATSELEGKVKKLREEYAVMIYRASKTGGRINQLSFLLSAGTFYELVMRYKYLQQYGDNRKTQVEQIQKTTAELASRQQQLAQKKSSQVTIKQGKVTEAQQLDKMKQEKSLVISTLSKQEKGLRAEIIESQRSLKKLDQRISSVIAREVARQNQLKEEIRREEARKAKAEAVAAQAAARAARAEEARRVAVARAEENNTPPPPLIAVKPEPVIVVEEPAPAVVEAIKEAKITVAKVEAVGANFASSRNRIPWPVKSGIISEKFGVKNHPVLKGVQIDNNGVNIQTSVGTSVQSVFDGIVMDVTDISGMGKVVAIQHGDYFTVYANLQQTFVKAGQNVTIRQAIGTAGEKDGTGEINFQVWKNTSRLNPEQWLVRK